MKFTILDEAADPTRWHVGLSHIATLADQLLRSANRARRAQLAEMARWFVSATVLAGEELDNADAQESGWQGRTVSCVAIDELLRFAARLHHDAVEAGDVEQVTDAIVLAAGLIILAEEVRSFGCSEGVTSTTSEAAA